MCLNTKYVYVLTEPIIFTETGEIWKTTLTAYKAGNKHKISWTQGLYNKKTLPAPNRFSKRTVQTDRQNMINPQFRNPD